MYFPYIRGKQYDLLALRELMEKDKISNNILPIIEPVILSATLVSTMETYIDKKRDLGVIINPKVGAFIDEIEEKTENYKRYYEKYKELLKNDEIKLVYILDENAEIELERLDVKYGIDNIIIVANNLTFIQDSAKIRKFLNSHNPLYVLTGDNRQFKRFIKNNRVILEDNFNKQKRNKDYLNIKEEFFSNTYKYYKEDSFVGFSDYVTIGEEYQDEGFAPYAVVIHITYEKKDEEDSQINICHFTSDSNDDNSNPAGKFGEALEKLIKWLKNNDEISETLALSEFKKLYDEQKYPGLGSIKKLSIMNHIELMDRVM